MAADASLNSLEKGYNVVIASVAGSGKTSLALNIATSMFNKRIILLTYNASLKMETRRKAVALGLCNLEIHSYHSLGVAYGNNDCRTDMGLTRFLKRGRLTGDMPNCDILIIDEAQDIKPLYYNLVKLLILDRLPELQLCIVGDVRQNVYKFMGADSTYLSNTDLWKSEKQFIKHDLAVTYRCPKPLTDFVNNVMLKSAVLIPHKLGGRKPRVLFANPYHPQDILAEIDYYLKLGYDVGDIIVMSYSTGGARFSGNPITLLENHIKQNRPEISIAARTRSGCEVAKTRKSKLLISTFHSAKGLERKVAIIYGFDSSFCFYDDCSNCPNILYVAATRASECITFVAAPNRDLLPFLNAKVLPKYVDIVNAPIDFLHRKCAISGRYQQYKQPPKVCILNTPISVARYTAELLYKSAIVDMLADVLPSKYFIKVNSAIAKPLIIAPIWGDENVSDITDCAASLLNNLHEKFTQAQEGEKIIFTQKSAKSVHNLTLLDKQPLDLYTDMELLAFAATILTCMGDMIHRCYQIKNYQWLTNNFRTTILNNLKITVGVSDATDSSSAIKRGSLISTDIPLVGGVDWVDHHKRAVFVTHFVDFIDIDHFLRLLICKFLDITSPNPMYANYSWMLLNLRTNECWKIGEPTEPIAEVCEKFQEDHARSFSASDVQLIYLVLALCSGELINKSCICGKIDIKLTTISAIRNFVKKSVTGRRSPPGVIPLKDDLATLIEALQKL